jgi:glycosyltransferase involved in cell wall biosynthesis
MRLLRLCLTGNEPRQRYLFQSLEQAAQVKAVVPFDDIDPLTKIFAGVLSFGWPRVEWWENFQMHPLVNRRRRKVLARGMRSISEDIDALLMWGSWFKPFAKTASFAVPFYTYIDQSRSLTYLPGEYRGSSRNKRSHQLQLSTYEAAEAVLCMSEWARTQTLESHTSLSPEKVIAVGWGPCGVDLSDEDLINPEREPIVLHVSNDFYRKGIDFLVETAAVVRRAIPRVRFVVIGRDNAGTTPTPTSGVEYLGRVSDKTLLADYFRRASVFFLPHRFDRSPHVLVEAMSAGLPLVASAQGGAIEIIRDRGTGYLCRVGAVHEYAEAIVELIRKPDLRQSIGKRSQALMRSYYTWPAIAERIVDIMRGNARIVSGHRRHAGPHLA